ncbi:GNAT family N-acetyltransferase [Gallibacterium salpingitidis]|uniref:GNAT family N-acetyltransferase n=1 Tax=Gallibacterium salpingitidis TaxID=505341 RepID=UPI00266EB5B4|nr:GNAT family N-acetyltransferase [Gallibacterium salpingitidis]WKT00740.1 GNAT family N-acetyltransferase [Gallibacterium salpingitidis]
MSTEPSTEQGNVIIRVATLNDAPQILAIYAPYVEKTAITFEYEVPTLAEFEQRMSKTLTKYPYIVAEQAGEILGYAYTSAFVGRAAYDWAVETTIYLKANQTKTGLGKKLYTALERICKAQNIFNLNACIGYPEQEDEFLTKNSANFHAHLGYRFVGEFRKCGYKFGRWYNMVWMEKFIAEHPERPEPVIWFPALDTNLLIELGIKAK